MEDGALTAVESEEHLTGLNDCQDNLVTAIK
jgi:hypothetical protein